MLEVAIIALAVAAVSALAAMFAVHHARRSANAAELSVAEAKRSADAAEAAAAAAAVSAESDRSAEHRARTPRLRIVLDSKVSHDGKEAIYRVVNDGPADLDSVVIHRPLLGEIEEWVVHPVARTGVTDYQHEVDLGPVLVTQYGRFTLSLGSRESLPEFRIRVVCAVGDEIWPLSFTLENPREPKPVRTVAVFVPDRDGSIRDLRS